MPAATDWAAAAACSIQHLPQYCAPLEATCQAWIVAQVWTHCRTPGVLWWSRRALQGCALPPDAVLPPTSGQRPFARTDHTDHCWPSPSIEFVRTTHPATGYRSAPRGSGRILRHASRSGWASLTLRARRFLAPEPRTPQAPPHLRQEPPKALLERLCATCPARLGALPSSACACATAALSVSE
jgi:hypothetical protein